LTPHLRGAPAVERVRFDPRCFTAYLSRIKGQVAIACHDARQSRRIAAVSADGRAEIFLNH
jgi:hypothetical protein